ncbi:MAG: hypothetical protein H6719_19970 [Sandaracinaceae bacterium]|nr:hypothetical protein [Sandaracinaceae bacterium]
MPLAAAGRHRVDLVLQRAEVEPTLLTDDACRKIFHASQGKLRHVDQLALHALIAAAAHGRDAIDGPSCSR